MKAPPYGEAWKQREAGRGEGRKVRGLEAERGEGRKVRGCMCLVYMMMYQEASNNPIHYCNSLPLSTLQFQFTSLVSFLPLHQAKTE